MAVVKYLREHFSAKFLLVFLVFIIATLISFTVFFVYQQKKSMTENLQTEGGLLSRILAHNSRLGVFVENQNLLKEPVESVMRMPNVISTAVYTVEGRMIIEEKKRPAKPANGQKNGSQKMLDRIKTSQEPVVVSTRDTFEFWTPVFTDTPFKSEEDLFLAGELSREKGRLLGFVKIEIDKSLLNQRIGSLLLRSFLIALILLAAGSTGIFLLIKGLTGPLDKLTERVRTMGINALPEEVPVETHDEIGKLAEAFNTMAASLRTRAQEKQTLEEQLRQSQKMEAVGTLAGGIAHDFNNILTAMMGFGSLLQMKVKDDKTLTAYADQVMSSAEKAAALTQRLLAFSRKQVITTLPLNLNDTVSGIEKLLTRLIGEDIELKTDISPAPLIIMADSGQIDQIIINLIANARDAMPGGGTVTMSTGIVETGVELRSSPDNLPPGRYALLCVSDTGTGIDEKIISRIFDPFFTTKEVGKGTGLGLSMVYGIVKQHSGYIQIESGIGRGTNFKIYLPLMDLTSDIKRAKPNMIFRGGSETILLAEDDESVRRFIRETFESHGYRVIESVNGEDAVQKFTENKDNIDLLLFDLVMPRMNGKDAYDEIKKIKREARVLFMSGYADDILQRKIILEEGINLISKPVKPNVLLEKAQETIQNKSFFHI